LQSSPELVAVCLQGQARHESLVLFTQIVIMFRVLLLALAAVHAAAFMPVAPAAGVSTAAARSEQVVMAAKKKGVNPALFATGIAPKKAKAAADKNFRMGNAKAKTNRQDGSWIASKPWVASRKAEDASVKFGLSSKLGSKERPGGGAGIFFLGGGRSRK